MWNGGTGLAEKVDVGSASNVKVFLLGDLANNLLGSAPGAPLVLCGNLTRVLGCWLFDLFLINSLLVLMHISGNECHFRNL